MPAAQSHGASVLWSCCCGGAPAAKHVAAHATAGSGRWNVSDRRLNVCVIVCWWCVLVVGTPQHEFQKKPLETTGWEHPQVVWALETATFATADGTTGGVL